MRIGIYLSAVIIMIIMAAGLSLFERKPVSKEREPKEAPNDWFFLQRSYPYQEINYEARTAAWQQARDARHDEVARGGLGWVFEGPLNIGGRMRSE